MQQSRKSEWQANRMRGEADDHRVHPCAVHIRLAPEIGVDQKNNYLFAKNSVVGFNVGPDLMTNF